MLPLLLLVGHGRRAGILVAAEARHRLTASLDERGLVTLEIWVSRSFLRHLKRVEMVEQESGTLGGWWEKWWALPDLRTEARDREFGTVSRRLHTASFPRLKESFPPRHAVGLRGRLYHAGLLDPKDSEYCEPPAFSAWLVVTARGPGLWADRQILGAILPGFHQETNALAAAKGVTHEHPSTEIGSGGEKTGER